MQIANTLAELKTKPSTENNAYVRLLGRDTPFDGYGGDYFWKADYTGAGNDNSVVLVTGVATGAYFKFLAEPTTLMPQVVSLSGVATKTLIFSKLVRAGELGSNRSIRFENVNQITSTLATPPLTMSVEFGGVSLTVASAAGIAANTSKPFILQGRITNQSSMNAQYVVCEIRQGNMTVPLSLSDAMTSADWTIDTSVNQTLNIYAQFGTANLTGATLTPKTMNVFLR